MKGLSIKLETGVSFGEVAVKIKYKVSSCGPQKSLVVLSRCISPLSIVSSQCIPIQHSIELSESNGGDWCVVFMGVFLGEGPRIYATEYLVSRCVRGR